MFIDQHADRETDGNRWGIEPICATLDWAVSSYYAAKARPPSARALRDAVMIPVLLTLWVANRKVYGARKLWKAAQRQGYDIGRDQVARLMRKAGIRGVSRSRRVRTTQPDDGTCSGSGPGQRQQAAWTSPPRPRTGCGSRT